MTEESKPDLEEGWYVEHKEKLKKISDTELSWKELKKVAGSIGKGYILKVEKGWVVK